MTKVSRYALLLVVSTLVAGLLCAGLTNAGTTITLASVNTQSGPHIYLQDAQEVTSSYRGAAGSAQLLSPVQADPLSLATSDFDGDGIPDLIVGYGTASGGLLALHHGNLDAFAPQSPESFQAIAGGRFPSPFLPDVQVVRLPVRPDFLAVGNFNGGHDDVIVASRGGNTAYVLPGDGGGKFLAPQKLTMPGPITALAAGKVGMPTEFCQVLVGTTIKGTPAVMVYLGSAQGLTEMASYTLKAPATAFDFGNLDEDRLADAVILAGGEILILHGSAGNQAKPILETASLPVTASAVALGRFVHDRDPRLQMAVLSSDGSIHIVAHGGIDSRGWTKEERKVMFAPGRRGRPDPFPPARTPWTAETWRIVETFPGSAPFGGLPGSPLLLRARISDHGADDVMVLNGEASQMAVIAHPNVPLGASSFGPGQQSTRSYATGAPVAAVSARVNVDARPGVIVLHRGQITPSVMMPLPDPTFNVNTTNDTSDANPGDGVCADSNGKCSLRAAIMEANALNGNDTIMLPAGTYTLTQGTELDITDGVSIVGAGASTTFVQAASAAGSATTKVFSVNPGGSSNSFATSFSGMTIRFGNNTIDNFGGASDFDTGMQGTGTWSITSCVITQNFNMTSPGDGGGLYFSNGGQGSGSVTISNSTISNNGADDLGGGLFVGSQLPLVLSNSTVSSNVSNNTLNNATVPGGGGQQQGAGIAAINPSGSAQTAIHNSTISTNQAVKDGGGILTLQGMLIDQGSVITTNTAGGNGAGLWSNTVVSSGFPSGETTTVSQSTITSNTATGNGGGVQVDTSSNGNKFAMSFSRIVGNHAASGNGLNNVSGTVTATDNWWGCTQGPGNTGCDSTHGTVSANPWITLTHTPNPGAMVVNATSTLTASLLKDSNNNAIAASNLLAFAGLPVTFGNAVKGTLSNAQTKIQSVASVSSASESGSTVTITTSVAHSFSAGQTVNITGVGVTAYDGVFTIVTIPTSTTFTYTDSITGLVSSSGGTAAVPAGIATATYSATASGTGHADVTLDNSTVTTSLQLTDFTLSGCGSISVIQGHNATCTVTVSPVNGFTGSVTLGTNGLPAGVSSSFNPNPVTGGSGTATLTLSATTSATLGTGNFNLTGSSGPRTVSISPSLTVSSNITILRPTTFSINGGLGGVSYNSAANAFDGNLSTFANGPVGALDQGSPLWTTDDFSGFGSFSGSATAINLKVSSAYSIPSNGFVYITYSTNGGSSFSNIYVFSSAASRGQQTDVVSLPTNTNLSNVVVEALVGNNSGASQQVYDIWIEVTQ